MASIAITDEGGDNQETESQASGSLVEELERLADLYEKGLLSEDEYNTAKASLLS